MGLSPQDALAALNDVEAADARARASQANRAGAPYLLLWGAIWVVGYVLTGLLPGNLINPMWMVLGLGGGVASMLMPRRAGGKAGLAVFLAIAAFVAATFWVMRPTEPAQITVFPPMIVALVYMLMGSVRQTRLMWVGAALFVLTMIGYAFLKPVLPFWLAAVGGGGLILGGLWMRQP